MLFQDGGDCLVCTMGIFSPLFLKVVFASLVGRKSKTSTRIRVVIKREQRLIVYTIILGYDIIRQLLSFRRFQFAEHAVKGRVRQMAITLQVIVNGLYRLSLRK